MEMIDQMEESFLITNTWKMMQNGCDGCETGARLCVSFYEMFAASALAVSFACGLIMFIYRMKSSAVVAVIIVATFWFKVATMVFIRFTTKRKIRTFLLLLQERGDVEQKALERGLGV